jgi:hypothetical protein
MKKYFFIIALYWLNTYFVIAQSPHYYIYYPSTDKAHGPYIMPTHAIADDFGPRDLAGSNNVYFHGGLDFNCWQNAGTNQKWYPCVSPQSGTIQDFDALTDPNAPDYPYKYGLVNINDQEGNGHYSWLFGHVFDDDFQFYDEYNHSIVLKRCENNDNDKWGLLLDFHNSSG